MYIVPILIGALLVVLLASTVLYSSIPKHFFTFGIFVLVGGVIGLTVVIYLLQKRIWNTKCYLLTPENISVVNGVIGSDKTSYGLKGVISMCVHQSMLMKMLGYGNLTFYFLGGSSVTLRNIPNPNQYLENIQQLISKGHVIVDDMVKVD